MKHEALYRIYLAYYAAKVGAPQPITMQMPSVTTTSDHAAVALAMRDAHDVRDLRDYDGFAYKIGNMLQVSAEASE